MYMYNEILIIVALHLHAVTLPRVIEAIIMHEKNTSSTTTYEIAYTDLDIFIEILNFHFTTAWIYSVDLFILKLKSLPFSSVFKKKQHTFLPFSNMYVAEIMPYFAGLWFFWGLERSKFSKEHLNKINSMTSKQLYFYTKLARMVDLSLRSLQLFQTNNRCAEEWILMTSFQKITADTSNQDRCWRVRLRFARR